MENKLDRSLIYYNTGEVTEDVRLEMYIYSLEDKLLGINDRASLWNVDSDDTTKISDEINRLKRVIATQSKYSNRIETITNDIGNPEYTSEQKNQMRSESIELTSLLVTDEELNKLKDELDQLKQLGLNYKVNIDVHNNFRNKGFFSGVYKVTYKLVRDLVNECFIDVISSDRTEIRVKLKTGTSTALREFFGMIDYDKNPVYGNTDLYVEPSINFYGEEQYQLLNWIPVSNREILLKLYEPLAPDIEEKTDFRIIMPLSQDIMDKVILFPAPPTIDVNILQPASYNIRSSFKKKQMKLSSWNNLVSSDYDMSTSILNKYFGSNTDGIELNVDYRVFDEYVFYSNAYDRLEVFKYKLQLVEGYNSSIAELQSTFTGSASGSLEFLNNVSKYQTRRDEVLNKFDNYEKYLYFESSSYESSSLGEYFPTSWPKTTTSKPHTLYHSTSSEAISWYDGITDSASLYDKNNDHSLVRTIPEHIREDQYSDNYETFVAMIGHQLDTLWLYTTHLEKMKDRDESLYNGMSKDLVYNVLSSYGWDGINDMQYDDLWYYTLGTDESGSNILTGSLAASQSLEWITATSESISSGDVQKEIWKRILNNLPYLNKTKGTKEGIRALINCYGIPSTELRIREYGGPEPLNNKSYYEYRKFTYALQIEPDNAIVVPGPADDGTIEFRFRTDYQTLPMTLLGDISGSGPNILRIGIDTNRSMSIESVNGDDVISSIPVNDGEWWSFFMTKGTDPYYDFHLKRTKYSRITHAYSASIDIGSPFPFVPNIWNIGSGSSGVFSGSMQEFRMWDTDISEDTMNNHTMAPTAYHGNQETASFDHLYFRLSLGTDTKKYNHSTTAGYAIVTQSQHPNYRNAESASFVGFPNKYTYEALEETYNQEWPDLSANRSISNKVRVEDNITTGSLHVDRRTETSAFDMYPLDNAKVGVYLSPTNEVDQDIAEFMGGFRIDDYIGSYENYYTNDYPDLRDLRHTYFSQYQGRYDTMDYFRLLNYFNTSIFKQIKEILPGRAKALTGLVIEPHILNRNKVGIITSKPTAENQTKEVEIGTRDEAVWEAERILYEPDFEFEKTDRSKYYWHDILYVNGVPIRVENDIALQQASQTFYENSREYDDNTLHYKPPTSGSAGEVISGSITGSSPEIKAHYNRPFIFVPLAIKNHQYLGCKITSTGFNISSPDTPDGSPVIEFTETDELIMRTQNPNDTGNLKVE